MAQLMPLPLIVSCFSKIQIGFSFLVPAHLGSPRNRAVKRVCVCSNTDQVLVGVSYTRLQRHLHTARQHCHEHESEHAAPSPATYKASTDYTHAPT